MTILATGACNGAARRHSAALDQERELQRRKGLSTTRGGTSNTMRALRAAEDARAREAWLASPERAAQRLARRQAAQASRVSANQHSPGTTSQQEASATALIPRLDALLSEQATLTQIMKGFDLQLQAGADGESLLCSSSFQEVLARLGTAQQHGQSAALAVPSSARAPPQGAPGGSGRAWRLRVARDTRGERSAHWAPSHRLTCSGQPPPMSPSSLRVTRQAQQQQRELLSVARERIVRDYPMLLEASHVPNPNLCSLPYAPRGEPCA